MLIAIAYCTKDQDQAERLAGWMAEIGPYPNHRLLVARDVRAKENVFSAAGFASVQEIVITDDAWDSWPQSCNNAFRHVGKHIEFTTKEPFLWLEADVAPIRAGWLDAIAAEYASCGKPFMGDRVEVEGVPLHCSGVAVYPGILSNHAGLVYLAQEMAWDVMAAEQIVPQTHFTKLIEHAWKHPTFESWEQVEREIAPETLLYHASKDGSLIVLLRERKNLQSANEIPTKAGASDAVSGGVQGPTRLESHQSVKIETQAATQPTPSTPLVCDIFIKTYPPDYPWLEYCLRSIGKFARDFRGIQIVKPNGESLSIPPATETKYMHRIVVADDYGPDGYLSQQVFKLYADEYTDADFILFTDSDTIFTRPVTPETYFTDGRIDWMMTPWANTETPWQPITEKFLGRPVEFEFMRRMPFMVPRWLLESMRAFCVGQHGMTFDKYVMSQPHRSFSEFNALGAFAYYFHRDRFNWINTEEVPADQWPPLTVLQKFSHGGLDESIKAEFELILSGGVESRHAATVSTTEVEAIGVVNGQRARSYSESNDGIVDSGSSAPPAQTLSETHANGESLRAELPSVSLVPWESKEQSLSEIRSLAERLKNFCGLPSHVRAVRLELHNAGVIALNYRFKRRKGKWKRKAKE